MTIFGSEYFAHFEPEKVHSIPFLENGNHYQINRLYMFAGETHTHTKQNKKTQRKKRNNDGLAGTCIDL